MVIGGALCTGDRETIGQIAPQLAGEEKELETAAKPGDTRR